MKFFAFIILFFLINVEIAWGGYPGIAVKNTSNNTSAAEYLESEIYFEDLNLFRQLIEMTESKLILKSVQLNIVEDPNGNSSGQTDLENKKILIKIPKSSAKCDEYCLRQILGGQVSLLILYDSRYPPAL